MIPPSPPSSARMMSATYLTDTMTVMAQNTSDRTPYTLAGSTGRSWTPPNVSFMA